MLFLLVSCRRKESRQVLENLKLNFSEDEDEEEEQAESKPTQKQISQVWTDPTHPELSQKLPNQTWIWT